MEIDKVKHLPYVTHDKYIISRMWIADYWVRVYIRGKVYVRTFQNNVLRIL